MAVYERELPEWGYLTPTIALRWASECRGPDGCFMSDRVVIWQSDCGCWVMKCLLCGNVDEARCIEDEAHRDAFNEQAAALQ